MAKKPDPVKTLLKPTDPRLPEHALQWYRLEERFLRMPTSEEGIAQARAGDRREALAAIAHFRNHLRNGTAPLPIVSAYILDALSMIVDDGLPADVALGLKVTSRPKMSEFYRRKAAFYVFREVAVGKPVEAACEEVANAIKAVIQAHRGHATVGVTVQALTDEEATIWGGVGVTQALMQRCYREYKVEMLETLHAYR